MRWGERNFPLGERFHFPFRRNSAAAAAAGILGAGGVGVGVDARRQSTGTGAKRGAPAGKRVSGLDEKGPHQTRTRSLPLPSSAARGAINPPSRPRWLHSAGGPRGQSIYPRPYLARAPTLAADMTGRNGPSFYFPGPASAAPSLLERRAAFGSREKKKSCPLFSSFTLFPSLPATLPSFSARPIHGNIYQETRGGRRKLVNCET